jgi:hypothetical protein
MVTEVVTAIIVVVVVLNITRNPKTLHLRARFFVQKLHFSTTVASRGKATVRYEGGGRLLQTATKKLNPLKSNGNYMYHLL